MLQQQLSTQPTEADHPVYRHHLALVAEPDPAPYLEVPLDRPAGAAKWFAARIGREPSECMAVAWLDTRRRALGYAVPYRGTLARIALEVRGLLVPALLANASAIIIAHNHPSGDPGPSAEDLAFTRRLAEAGDVVGVRLLDHLIIGSRGRYVSLKEGHARAWK